ncbi:unnamed protein product [Mesocestoides corti]|uniref:J domain-containing protein n=1 Tax=Mesocestoides corti TaxID=53468 RepID=A0A0R3UKP6_MESCO|nr:unnamed protein product [Mesocestoides corti]
MELKFQNLYEHLEITSSATNTDIKRAYRRLAKKYHPDKNSDPDTEKKFKEISFAYECLSDPDKRRRYDAGQGRKACENDGGDGFPDFGFSSVFSSMFGGGSNMHQNEGGLRGADVLMDLPVTLTELYNGEFVDIVRSRPVKKSKPGTRECNCHMEMKTQYLGPGRFQMVQQRVCSECPNFEFITEDRQVEVEIEPGMPDGYTFSFPGEGEPHPDGDNGDLKFIIRQQAHHIFHRRGDDLFTNVSISLTDALVGFAFELTHLDGHKVVLKRTEVTWPGAVMVVANEGLPNYENKNKKGSLIVTFDVVFPRNRALTASEIETVKSIFGEGSETSKTSVTYGVPGNRPTGLDEGRTGPIVYNGFLLKSAAAKHLTNVIS